MRTVYKKNNSSIGFAQKKIQSAQKIGCDSDGVVRFSSLIHIKLARGVINVQMAQLTCNSLKKRADCNKRATPGTEAMFPVSKLGDVSPKMPPESDLRSKSLQIEFICAEKNLFNVRKSYTYYQ